MCGVQVPVNNLTMFSYSSMCCFVVWKCIQAYVSLEIIKVFIKKAAVCGGSLKFFNAWGSHLRLCILLESVLFVFELGVNGMSIPKYLNLSTLSHRVRWGGMFRFFVFAWFIGIPISDAPVTTVCSMSVMCFRSRSDGGMSIVPSSAKKRR